MSAHFRTPPADRVAYPAGFLLVKRRHVDLMRVCSDACRRADAR
ncbi:hypothetical protein GA0070624_4842 [Micromonospora rhizosphaerae]|uniref:Uncharacterized protein n=1 Tax=Micromonospora rhizosphaerae TaxID=568872 RepID=A0A1C6SX51_9ACTN|nr:hypothetical protein [Micromonospora rhizosphaerae]SCL33863.1 hypothetical protein GA0070624_4842 [Micromonospora rhizosphaerae]